MTSTRQSRESTTLRVTRRTALAVGIAATAVWLLPLRAKAAQRVHRLHEELYVFPAQQTGKVALLVTCSSRTADTGPTETRFHIGGAMHSVRTARLSQNAELEVPGVDLAGKPLWAERLCIGSRRRIASPFLAALIAEEPSLGILYDQGSPDTDHHNLMAPLAHVIGTRAQRSGFRGDPQAYGRRLAATLLPDVFRFDPARPAGFTFAARNGRHPADPDTDVVNSILNGAVADQLPLEAVHVASL